MEHKQLALGVLERRDEMRVRVPPFERPGSPLGPFPGLRDEEQGLLDLGEMRLVHLRETRPGIGRILGQDRIYPATDSSTRSGMSKFA